MLLRLVLVLLAGCGARSIRADDGGSDGDVDTDTTCGPEGESWVEIERMDDAADLLFLVDNSNSMREEQANLTANIGDLLGALIEPPDEDGDGAADWRALPSLHVGVITGDMGTSGYPVTTCDDSDRGDDGELQHLPSTSVVGCDATYPKFLTWDAAAPDPNLAHDFECIASFGTGGCGFVQTLGAIEKAVTVHAAPGGENEGFYRPGAALAVFLLTDGDDCTVSDPWIFGDDDSLGPMNLRCFENPEMLRPVEELVASLLALKPGHPDRLLVAGVLGVPPDLVALSAEALASDDVQTGEDFERILDDPRMVVRIDDSPEGGGARLVPSCDVPGLGIADPPVRLVEAIRDLDAQGNGGVVQSICQSDWRPATEALARRLERLRGGGCLPSPLVTGGRALATGEHADCVVQTISETGSCSVESLRVGTEDGRAVCQMCQAGDGAAPFERDFRGVDVSICATVSGAWSYTIDDATCGTVGKIRFRPDALPADGEVMRLECAASAMPPAPGC